MSPIGFRFSPFFFPYITLIPYLLPPHPSLGLFPLTFSVLSSSTPRLLFVSFLHFPSCVPRFTFCSPLGLGETRVSCGPRSSPGSGRGYQSAFASIPSMYLKASAIKSTQLQVYHKSRSPRAGTCKLRAGLSRPPEDCRSSPTPERPSELMLPPAITRPPSALLSHQHV